MLSLHDSLPIYIIISALKWRNSVAYRTRLCPTIDTSGPKLEGYDPLWKGTMEVGSPAEVDVAIDRLQAMEVDFVKITDNKVKQDIFLYAVNAAKGRGIDRKSTRLNSSH